jgi:hypothetical protein
MLAERREKVHVDLPGVDQLGNFECPVIRDSAASHHAWLEAQAPAQRGSLGTTPMDDDDPNAQG